MKYLLMIVGLMMGFSIRCQAYTGYLANGLSWDKDITIEVGGKVLSGEEYSKEFDTIYSYNSKTKKFMVRRSNQEKLEEKTAKLRDKKYHRRHEHYRSSRRSIWLQCKVCGEIFEGSSEAQEHVDSSGHTSFQRLFFRADYHHH